MTTGLNACVLGSLAAQSLTTGNNNTVMGRGALNSDTKGSGSTALGYGTLNVQNFTTATNTGNVAIGLNAGQAQTVGILNTIIGYAAGDALTDSDNNTAVGYNALTSEILGYNSTAIGRGALQNQSFSTATEASNTAVGQLAGAGNTTGAGNTFLGHIAGYGGTTATRLTTGVRNTVIGGYASVNAVSANDGQVLGNAVSGAGGFTTVGQGTADIRAENGVATWATVSDSRYKKDIADSTAGLSFINALTPRTFKYRTLGELPETFYAYKADSTEVFKNSDTNHGFIAQEVKTAIDAHSELKDGFRLWAERDDGGQEVAEAALIPILVKAIQELTARIAVLEG